MLNMLNSIRIAVVEDSAEDMSNCLNMLKKYSEEKNLSFEIDSFEVGDAFLSKFKMQYDFIILDINLSAMNGMDVAAEVRKKDEDVIIMFVTNLARYATKGYEVGAIDFAIKPLSYASFYLKMERVLKQLQTKNNRASISLVLSTEGGFNKVDANDIYYIEIFGHDLVFHLEDKTITTYGTLKTYEEKLKDQWFIRCNSCYLVNARKIKSVDRFTIYLFNGKTVVISHPKKKHFIQEFKQYMLKEGD